MKQTRYDLEFLAEMLGVEQISLGGLSARPGLSCYSDEVLGALVAKRAADPIVNSRAQRRILDLGRSLPLS